ncbi:hypothetical protein [Cyanobium sp. FACHB-13342]|uniref:hypothetical protein n=1 Tax=Cyanobium sp. FACHB-13342 TaxID=2692793 RepID=UPI001681247D|nr:hypothetical protein [Cyanobium sp. FACHB-13342]MBD2424078.1 hypothetical protein [Cyanobium sp. FACHB-13342]
MGSLLRVVGLAVGALLASGPVQAGVVTCVRPGVPVACSVGVGAPGVGAGAPGVGVRPAAGPGVGPNYGGPANVHPAAGPGAGPNVGRPANRPGMR